MTAQEALAALGDTADAVAATLRAAGIKGRPQACSCPAARYMQSKGFLNAVVMFGYVYYGSEFGRQGGRQWLPDAVANFVTAFDRGRYPDLEAP